MSCRNNTIDNQRFSKLFYVHNQIPSAEDDNLYKGQHHVKLMVYELFLTKHKKLKINELQK